MKKVIKYIIKFFFAEKSDYRNGHIFDNWTARGESIMGFILFLILPIFGLIYYNNSISKDLTILRNDKAVMDSLDIKVLNLDKIEDSIGLSIANSIIDSVEKNIKFAKIKRIKNHSGFWYTDVKTDIKKDYNCISVCKREYDEDIKQACLGKCIKIVKYNDERYIPAWSDTIWTDGVKLKGSVSESEYINATTVKIAAERAHSKITEMKDSIFFKNNLVSTEDRIITYDKYSKEYIDRKLDDYKFINGFMIFVLALYLTILIIRFLNLIKVKNKKFKMDVEKVWNAILVNGFYEELRNNHFLKLDNFKCISKISGISDWNRLDDIIRYINTEKI